MTMTTATHLSSPLARPARRRPRRTWRKLGLYAGIAAIALWCLGPFYWMVVTAFRDVGYTFDTTPWPAHVSFDNFRTVFDTSRGNHFGQALLNSMVIGIAVTVLAMVLGGLAAYALARLHVRGKFLVLGVVLGASMFPGVALVTPLFQLFTGIHWLGTYPALILPEISFALPLAVWILTSFFAEMPWELEQAARIDGCTAAQAFRLVILPLAAPALFTTAILVFISSWNEYLLSSLLANGNPDVAPVTVAIANFTGTLPHQEPYTAVMAAGAVVTIPLVALVLAFQRRIISGLTAGAIK
ncbi:carbohydrate ABC transporter permease [Amycolatopsis orientalis]|uniref:carbohydrate ABC transporter permease n=1 Tax=Amycolatopsis orientalis TaxID=31958 RepID=UPI00039AEAC1|nr:carbohydrate ABC transporter permease [Amycolatopsis orientalis]